MIIFFSMPGHSHFDLITAPSIIYMTMYAKGGPEKMATGHYKLTHPLPVKNDS